MNPRPQRVHTSRPKAATGTLYLLVVAMVMACGTPQPALSITRQLAETGDAPSGQIAFSSTREHGHLWWKTIDLEPEIYVMRADGSGLVNLTMNPAADWLPAWSPDGSKVSFVSDRAGNWEIYVMAADGSDQTRLTHNDAMDRWPAWSPDGTTIAFDSSRDGNSEIYVMDADGANQTRLTHNDGEDMWPAWSPDGSRIAFHTDREGTLYFCEVGGWQSLNWQIYIMDAGGAGQTNVTNNPWYDLHQAWSPDGTTIAFHSHRDHDGEIYVMDADGTDQTNITNHVDGDGGPSWSPDGRHIVFESRRDGNWELYLMRADGTGQTRLTYNASGDRFPTWGP